MDGELELRDKLWGAANKLRGQLDAAAYKHVVLALLFLRFVACGRGPLRCPAAARWERLRPGRLDAALSAVERANPSLRGALPRGLDALARVDELLELFGDLGFDDRRDALGARDSLGKVYEYFLARFARAEGRRGGQFYTPRCVVRLLGAMLGPLTGTVYDPCCGSGGMFIQSGGVAEAFGQESNPATWRLARTNLALHGLDVDLGLEPADSFLRDLHPGRRADFVLANPPFNQRDWGAARLRDDARWRYGPPPPGNANFAWLQHILAHLGPGGTAGVVLANGALSAAKAGEGACRRNLVEAGWVDAIVALPPQLFHSTPIPASLWILSRARPDTTLFVDAREAGRLVERARRELVPDEIARVADGYRAYRAGAASPERGFSAVATRARIAACGHVLSPGRYVERAAERAREPARRRLRRLAAEWQELAEESERLTREIEELGLGQV
ncbi:MAG: N-6 DNA methylase [Planctomycetota bacterium]|jgi:type I restriction enzyme M protein